MASCTLKRELFKSIETVVHGSYVVSGSGHAAFRYFSANNISDVALEEIWSVILNYSHTRCAIV